MKKLLIICPSRLRPDRIQEMLRSFDNTKSEGTDIVIYVSDCDPRLEEYKNVLRDRNLIVGKRLPISHVYNYCVRQYPDYQYYGEVCDDHVYHTKGWDDILIGEIASNGGWGMAWGWGQIHPREVRLPQAAIMSGNLVRALGFFSTPVITSAYNDRFAIDLCDALNCGFYRPDVIVEHKHVLNNKAPMDDNYRWVLSQDTLETGKKQYEDWRTNHMASDIDRVSKFRKMITHRIGAMVKCYHNTDYLAGVLRNYAWVDKIILQNYRFPSVKETTDDTKEIADKLGFSNIQYFTDTSNNLQQHELTNRAIEELRDTDLLYFVDADEFLQRADQIKIADFLLTQDTQSAHTKIKDYSVDLFHQNPPRDLVTYDNNWCMVAFKPETVRFKRLRQSTDSKSRLFGDITMHHFGAAFPEEKLKWKIAWEANEEKIAEQRIWDAINKRVPCEPPPQEIMDYL